MLAIAFLNPLLLWAVPLCSVPIIIHLLNRRRFKKVPWAAMEYLLAAMKRNRKRLRMEQWLVLLLRTLAVLLLVALVSRPQFGGGGLLSSKTHHIVLLDDSASMTQRSGSTTLFVKAQDRVRTMVDELAVHRSGDLFSLVRTSRPAQPDLWNQRVGPELGKRVATMLKEFACTDGASDLGSGLGAVVKRSVEVTDAGKTQFYVVGDTRAHDWSTEDDKPRPALLAALHALRPDQDHVTVMGAAGPANNLTVTDVRLVDRLAVVGVPTTFAVEVHNHGLDPTTPTTLAVEIDGQSRVVLTVPNLAPNEKFPIPFGHTFHQAGPHRLDAQLEATEAFPIDDRRTLALDVGPGPRKVVSVVGVVETAKYRTLRETAQPTVYLAHAQATSPAWSVSYVLQADGPPMALLPSLSAAVAEVDPGIAFRAALVEEVVDRSLARERLLALLSGFFGGLALLLALIGLYGLMAYNVARRRNEIGIRLALGAARGRVVSMIVGEVGRLVAGGVVVGVAVALAAGRLVQGFLFGITPNDPGTLAVVTGLVLLVAGTAGAVPAWRASRMDPAGALREE